jgi:ribonuclease HI
LHMNRNFQCFSPLRKIEVLMDNQKDRIFLCTDGSVSPQTKIGYGANLITTQISYSLVTLKKKVRVKRFEQTSSTRLELQTLLWALEDVQIHNKKVSIYTDSQNIVGLLGRRKKLIENNYCSKKGVPLKNALLYQKFYESIASLDCELIKVRGHLPSQQKENIDRIFSLVDKASRTALRESYND